MKSVPIST